VICTRMHRHIRYAQAYNTKMATKKKFVVIFFYCSEKIECSEDLERINPGNFRILDIRYDDSLANLKMFGLKSVQLDIEHTYMWSKPRNQYFQCMQMLFDHLSD